MLTLAAGDRPRGPGCRASRGRASSPGTVRGGSPLAPIPNAPRLSSSVAPTAAAGRASKLGRPPTPPGRTRVAGLPAGDYRIWVERAVRRRRWISAWIGGGTIFESATKSGVPLLGDVQAGADVVLFAGGTITGTRDGAGPSLSSAQVTAVRVDGTTPVDVRRDGARRSDGSYSPGWPCSRVRTTSASAPPYQSDWVTTWLGGTAAGRRLHRRCPWPRARPLPGRTSRCSGARASRAPSRPRRGPVNGAYGVRLRAEPVGADTIGRLTGPSTNASGAFSVRGLPAGTYRLQVYAPYSSSDLLNAWVGGARPDFAIGHAVPPRARRRPLTGADVVLQQGGGLSRLRPR